MVHGGQSTMHDKNVLDVFLRQVELAKEEDKKFITGESNKTKK